jgi:hypothetical protein
MLTFSIVKLSYDDLEFIKSVKHVLYDIYN